MFLIVLDASNHVKARQILFHLLDEVIVEVGVAYVVKIITNDASNYVVVGKLVVEK